MTCSFKLCIKLWVKLLVGAFWTNIRMWLCLLNVPMMASRVNSFKWSAINPAQPQTTQKNSEGTSEKKKHAKHPINITYLYGQPRVREGGPKPCPAGQSQATYSKHRKTVPWKAEILSKYVFELCRDEKTGKNCILCSHRSFAERSVSFCVKKKWSQKSVS